MQPLRPQRAAPAALLDDHVADLARRRRARARRGRRARRRRRRPVPQKTPSSEANGRARAEARPRRRWRPARRCRAPRGVPSAVGERVAQREGALPAGEVARRSETVPELVLDRAGRADADAVERRGLGARGLGRLVEGADHLGRDVARARRRSAWARATAPGPRRCRRPRPPGSSCRRGRCRRAVPWLGRYPLRRRRKGLLPRSPRRRRAGPARATRAPSRQAPGIAEQRVDLARAAGRASARRRATTTAAPPSAIQRALAVWWSAAACG